MNIVKAKKRKVLYLPSTPLNLLVSIAHAVEFSSEQTAQIILIDQKKGQDDNIYFNALKVWKTSPFERVELTLGVAKGKCKIKERKANFVVLADLINYFPADVIAVGSDRRVEFQYLMHLRCRSAEKSSIEGWYLDDGLYSYAGRPHKWFKDSVNDVLKKIIYGFWWQEPKTVGASSWIKKAWLFQPKHAVAALQKKQTILLLPEWFTHAGVRQFSQSVCQNYGLNKVSLKELRSIKLFLLIPHPNNIKKMKGYEARIHKFLIKLHQLGIRVAVKYHPRSEQLDSLQLVCKYQALLVHSALAFEFVLPFLAPKTVVVGDVGTSLLTAQWLCPNLNVYAVLDDSDAFQNSFKFIYEQLGIKIVTDFKGVSIPSVVLND